MSDSVDRRPRIAALVSRGAGALLLAGAAQAQGGPPLRTDDPGTPGDGRWELNFAFTFERSAGRRELEAPLLDLNYGLGERLQLKYEVPWVHLDEPGSGTSDGLGNSTAGVKWRFADARGSAPALSCYPQLEFQNPGSSSSERGLAEPGSALFLPLEVAWEFGAYGLGVEVGREFREVGADGWAAGVAIGRSLGESCELLAEVHGEASAQFDSSAGVLDFGARIGLGSGCRLLGAVGFGLWSQDSERTDLAAYLGLQLEL